MFNIIVNNIVKYEDKVNNSSWKNALTRDVFQLNSTEMLACIVFFSLFAALRFSPFHTHHVVTRQPRGESSYRNNRCFYFLLRWNLTFQIITFSCLTYTCQASSERKTFELFLVSPCFCHCACRHHGKCISLGICINNNRAAVISSHRQMEQPPCEPRWRKE